MKKKRIFVSHISSESSLAQALKARLLRDFPGRLDIFVSSDQSSIGAGAKWLEEADEALKGADLQIVLASRQSIGRPWVNFEAGAVWLRGIPVIPACHSGLRPADLQVPLSLLQSIAYSDPAGLRKLYDAVAGRLGVDTPAADFTAVAAELAAVEAAHVASLQSLEIIREPRILCAATAQYAQPELEFDLDIAAIENAFPGRVVVEKALTKKRLLALLTGQRFDIVHLVLPVHPYTGALIFSAVDTYDHLPLIPDAEMMSPASFASLLVESKTRLVVLATCRALLLAVEVHTVANMAASEVEITGRQAADWAECFYGLLAQGRSLYKSFDLTRSQVSTPMLPIRQCDVAFAVAADPAG